MIDVRKDVIETLEVLLIPAGILAGFMLKRDELTRAEAFAYFVFSWGASCTFPSLIREQYPTIGDSGMGFLNFGCAIFGGLALLNGYRILSSREFWVLVRDWLVRRFMP